nr:EOG090X0AGI [Eubosmina coregoni]
MAGPTKYVTTIREAWHQLHGILCVYKPTGMSCYRLRHQIITNICRDINLLEPRQPRTYVSIEAKANNSVSLSSGELDINFADLALVNGPAIVHDDLKLGWATTLGFKSSGVVVFGVNRGNKLLSKMIHNRPLAVYQIKAEFGLATDNHWDDGKVWEKTTFHHLSKGKLDRVLSSIQAANQKSMFRYCGVDPSSQTAYEMASKGLLRPAVKGPPVIYSIKCILFDPPNFTLEIHSINENEEYLSTIVHDLGLALKTTAACKQIRCVRYGCFTVDDSLLRKHWSLEHIPQHMSRCVEKLKSLPETTPNLVGMNDQQQQRELNSNERT